MSIILCEMGFQETQSKTNLYTVMLAKKSRYTAEIIQVGTYTIEFM